MSRTRSGIIARVLLTPARRSDSTSVRRDAIAPVVACALVLANLAIGAKADPNPERPLDIAGYVLAATAIIAFTTRRTHPTLCVVLVFSATALYGAADYPTHPGMAAVFVALYFAVLRSSKVVALALVLALGLAVVSLATTSDSTLLTRFGAAAIVLSPLAPVLLAITVRGYRRRAAELEERLTLTARARSSDANRLLAQQRLAIARDLHDTVAHSVAVISIQSGAALHVLDSDPAAARSALTIIHSACRQVLAETKLTLASLREDETRVAPTMQAVAATAREAGLTVEVTEAGSLVDVPAVVLEVCGRVAQEAVTNTLRHSSATEIVIAVDASDTSLTFAFSDNGDVVAPDVITPGHGLLGMAERVRAVGGNFAAQPGESSGFRIEASIPLDPSPARPA